MAQGRRRFGGVAVAIVAAMVLAACAPPTAEDVDEPDTDTEPAVEETDDADADGEEAAPTDGGRLILARTGDIDNLDPHLATAFQTFQTLELVYDTLFELTPELDVTDGLATDFVYDDAGTEMTVTLREAEFHDGSSLTADDVIASIERILDEDTGAVARANLLSIAGLSAPDDRTVVFELDSPDATLPSALADPNTAILSAAAIEAGTVGSEPMGTGPFAFNDWQQGQAVLLDAHTGYWGDGPFVDELQLRVIPDESSVLAGLRAGEFHVGVLNDPTVVTQIDESQLTVERSSALAYRTLMLNNTRGPLGDERVRQAISCAIDREQLVESVMFGEGQVTGPFTIPAFASDPYDGLPCDGPDPDLSRDLLEEAGEAEGFSLETIVITGGYDTATNEAQTLQAQLAEIGVDLELEILETNIYVERWLDADFDAAVALNGGRPDPHQMYARYFTSNGNLNDVATHSSETLDELFEAGRTETDPEARVEIYNEITRELNERSPWAWLFTGFEYRVLQPELDGFVPMPTGSLKSLRAVTLG